MRRPSCRRRNASLCAVSSTGTIIPHCARQRRVHESGVSVLMVEQNANMALSIADRGYVLATGRIALADEASALLANDELKRAYLGR